MEPDCFFSTAPHKWRINAYNGGAIFFSCSICKKNEQRTLSEKSREEMRQYIQEGSENSESLHALWKSFQTIVLSKEYDYLGAADEWLKDHPEAMCVNIDDAHFMSAALYLIPSKNEHSFMGVNVVYLTQWGEPQIMFLYPSAIRDLANAVSKLQEMVAQAKTSEVENVNKRNNKLLAIAAEYFPTEVSDNDKKHENG